MNQPTRTTSYQGERSWLDSVDSPVTDIALVVVDMTALLAAWGVHCKNVKQARVTRLLKWIVNFGNHRTFAGRGGAFLLLACWWLAG